MEIAGIRFGRRRGEVRCPYCHDRLDGACVACEACGTALHEECRKQHGRCPTLGCSGHARPHLVARASPALDYGPILDDAGIACLARLAALRPALEVEWNARGRPGAGARRRLRGEVELNETALRLGAALVAIGTILFSFATWAASRPPTRGAGDDAIVFGILAGVFAVITAILGAFALRASTWSAATQILDAGQFSVGVLTVEKRATRDGETWVRTLWLPEGAVELGDGPGDVVDVPPAAGSGSIGPDSGEVPVAVWHGATGASAGVTGARPTLYVQPVHARGFLVTRTRPRAPVPTPQRGPALPGAPSRTETGDEASTALGRKLEHRSGESTG